MTARYRHNAASRSAHPAGSLGPPVAWQDCVVSDAREPINHLHRHGQLEIGWCRSGHGVLLIEGRMLPFSGPCVALVAAEDWHFHHSAPGTTSDWTFVFVDPARLLGERPEAASAALLAARLRGERFPHVLGERERPALAAIASALATACRARGERGASGGERGAAVGSGRAAEPVFAGLIGALLAEAETLPGRGGARDGARADARARLLPALRLIAQQHHQPLPMPRLARAAGLSASGLRAAFVAAFGCAPKPYLTRLRVDRAAAALAGDRRARVIDVALACGFASLSAFNRAFRAAHGVSPRRWRAQAARQRD